MDFYGTNDIVMNPWIQAFLPTLTDNTACLFLVASSIIDPTHWVPKFLKDTKRPFEQNDRYS